MIKRTVALGALGSLLLAAAPALAGPVDDTLVVNDEIEMTTRTAAPEHLSDVMDEVLSGWHFRGDETRLMQADDFDNPGMIFVEQARDSGVRAVYPKYNEEAGEVRTLEMQVNDCRVNQMGAEELKYTSVPMQSMVALISSVSRGMPVNVAIDGPAQETWEKGKEIYYTRFGQLELACANCHEDNYGNMIRADHLSQGQINGFPVYRLKNTKLNAAHDRFKGCIRDTRAETFAPGSPEFVALELYVGSRGNGLSVEGPSVRN